MSDLKRLIARELATKGRDRLRGTVASEPAQKFFDPTGLKALTWVVDVDVGGKQLLRDVPIKINGPQARLYAKVGFPVFLERDEMSRWQVVAPADRRIGVAVIQELDEDLETAAGAGNFGFTVTREVFDFYKGDLAAQPTALFDPGADVDLLIWIDAQERFTMNDELLPADGAAIGVVRDRSSSLNDAAQPTSTLRPLYRRGTAGQNARQALDFDGGNDRLQFGTNIPGQQLSIFLFLRRDGTGDSTEIALETEEYQVRTSTTGTDQWSVGAGGGQNFSGSTLGNINFTLIEVIANAFNDIDMYQDGVFQATGTLTATGNGFAASGIGDSSTPINGRIAEALVFDRAMNDTDRQAVESYFNQKYDVRFSRWNNGVTPFPAVIRRDAQGNIV